MLSVNRDLIFNLNGPASTVAKAKENKQDLDVYFRQLGINGPNNGRFHDICRYNYYLETLKGIKVGVNDPVLSEVCKKEVYLSPGTDGKLLGHEVLSILIDRSPTQGVSDSWQKTILSIAGDPRVTSSHASFLQWWALLTEERISKVKGWLSRFDLKLFLKVLESYGQDTGNTDLVRMFPARKKFLEGLLDQGLVLHTRLFLSNHADLFTKRNYKKGAIPKYATVNNPDISMIYLQVGDLHVIEGTHNFKFWVFPAIPQKSSVLNYARHQFGRRELSGGLHDLYKQEFDFNNPVADITHSPKNCNWQSKAINYLQTYGIELNIEMLFSKEDYLLYRRLYGLPNRASNIKTLPLSNLHNISKTSITKGKNKSAAKGSAIDISATSIKTTKPCQKCHKRKSLSAFYPAKKMKGGYSRWCRKCFDTAFD